MRNQIRFLVAMIFVLLTIHPQTTFAQAGGAAAGGGAAGAGESKSSGPGGPRKQLATIVFAGLGGAILGLSTLSFYGRPQEKLNNIAIGFAFGVIAGTGFVTYKAMSNPSEFYGNDTRLEMEGKEKAQLLLTGSSLEMVDRSALQRTVLPQTVSFTLLF